VFQWHRDFIVIIFVANMPARSAVHSTQGMAWCKRVSNIVPGADLSKRDECGESVWWDFFYYEAGIHFRLPDHF
jgi:hypothetical protein